jgi:hypothetical protein
MTTGAEYAEKVRAEYVLNESQDVLVDHIAATMDLIDTLPLTDAVELRQQRALLSRLLGQLNLPDADDAVVKARQSQTSRQASRAARARWARNAEVS